MLYWLLAILVVVSYFVGNINFGKMISAKKNVDITKKGSGNAGATNVFRNVGAKYGYLTLLLDVLKGVACALTGLLVFGGFGAFPDGLIGLYSCGLAAIVGHIFPVIYKFKGGKGISTTMGVFLVAQPIVMLIVFVLGFIFVWFVKYVSMASLLIVALMVLWENLTLPEPNLVISLITFAIFVLTWFAHRANIERLLVGKETETNIKRKIFKEKKIVEKREIKAEKKAETTAEKQAEKLVKKENAVLKEEQKIIKKQEKIEKKTDASQKPRSSKNPRSKKIKT